LIILDSDVVIEVLQKKSPKGDEAVKQILSSSEQPCITVITLHEVLLGLYKYGRPLREFLQFPVLDYTKKDAVLSSKLELEAEKSGNPALRTDAMIAAIAINNGLSVYTFNVKHFVAFKTQGLKLFGE
jgi:tRNA(fMet)-specific endonuclease VapC